MFNRKPYKAFFTGTIFIALLILSISYLKPLILNVLLFPSKIVSSFIADTKAMVGYKFIQNENRQLKKQIASLIANSITVNELAAENDRLNRLLSFKKQAPFVTIAARVIARDSGNWSRGVVIDKGFKQGVKSGNVVITEAGLAGRVVEVWAHAAKVMLLNDANSAVSASLQRSQSEGLASGTLLGGIVMRYLEKDSDIAVGDIVVTSGLTRNYPSAIPLGSVAMVQEESHGLGKYATVKPFVDLKQVEEVLIITQ
ncbi:MAG: rod shape-determining protein MreC [Omnitrophica WOR_2 bacterium GWF2_43_52]|nr:MAG: rod shape-determining protein MreC [Omnitrophica WOR_2 bacterium GWA2_44_7]OGX13950.1 MAG: rod shape-determining protein MreC [Omnitrophica WOR_2 bacterium GWC2_44_8]OGX20903.1 MAG: rod shape-determining protein MreC [Omnitrophica WOR_2 bacterium GWF2_43_52]OGX57067.1 MAG: rod shape-determining protein MreC [Omnitrophica WOR_2 bacterium RIFOXYC2_FULL_43_9]HAH21077.1 rod shape-determining protein MreC [Candidatus Omnitrophota bacterium]